MKKLKTWCSILASATLLLSCGEAEEKAEPVNEPENIEVIEDEEPDPDRILTEAERDALTPDDVVAEFKQGNEKFIIDSLTKRDRRARIEQTSTNQMPKAMVLSCIDSRVPVEEIFDQGLGDLFIGRIAGNFADTEMLGSLEYATKVAGSKAIVVLGHKNCGAVKSAIANVELGNITELLEHIQPAVEMTNGFPEDQRTIENKEFVNAVVKNNVLHTIEQIREESPIISELESKGEIKVLGAFYDVTNGKVEFL